MEKQITSILMIMFVLTVIVCIAAYNLAIFVVEKFF
jgi:hypothetical protein